MIGFAEIAAEAESRAARAERIAAAWKAYARAREAWYFNRDLRPERERELWVRVDEAREALMAEGVDVRKALEEVGA